MDELSNTEVARIPTKPSTTEQSIRRERVKSDIDHIRQIQPRPKPEQVLHLIDAYKTDNPDILPEVYGQLKFARSVGKNGAPPFGKTIDGAIAQALSEDKKDIVEALLTPGNSELTRIDSALWESSVWLKVLDEDKQDAMWQTLTDIHSRKEQEFRLAAKAHGMSEDVVTQVLEIAADPESALAVPKDFWQTTYPNMDTRNRDACLAFRMPLPTIVDAISKLDGRGDFGYHLSAIVLKVARLNDAQESDTYIQSISDLMQQLQTDDELSNNMDSLLNFQDPRQAYGEAVRLFADLGPVLPSLQLRQAMTGQLGSANELIILDNDQLTFVAEVKQLLSDLGVDDPEALRVVSGSVVRHKDKEERRSKILASKEFLSGSNVPKEFIPAVLATGNPQEAMRVLASQWQQLAAMSDDLKTVFKQGLYDVADTRYVDQFFRVADALANRGIVLGKGEIYDFRTFVARLSEKERTDEETDREIENFIDKNRVSAQLFAFYKKNVADIIQHEGGNTPSDFQEKRDPFSQVTELQAIFQRVGIPEDVARKMYASWRTYDYLAKFEDKPLLKTADRFSLEKEMKEKIKLITSKLEAVKQYIENYGIEELLEVHNTFGIVNFTKATTQDGELDLEKIHRQLERWNDPSQEVKILSFNAVSSHNLAFKRDLDQVFEQVGEDGTFCFEAGSKNDITRFIRMVGDRERKAGRTPSIKVLRVAGHGSPKGVELSADDFWSINDFPRKPTGELDKDTQFMEFDEDLGDDYLFVLAACLTADDVVDGGQNFASDINTWYGKEVSAAKESTINVSLLPEGREERVMHWVTRPDKPGPRKGVSRTYPKRMSQPQAVRV